MAYLYKRKRSPFWWIGYRTATGEDIQEPTTFRIGNGPDRQRAESLRAERTLSEKSVPRFNSRAQWSRWAKEFISVHYAENLPSRTRFLSAWRTMEMFLTEHKIMSPCNLTREHCLEYLTWRKKSDVKNAKYKAGHNTALLELKLLSLVMKEAIRRGFAKENPVRDLGIKRAPRKVFPEYTDEVLKLVVEAIPQEPEPRKTFFNNSFLIARWHGVRLSETYLNPQTQVWQQEIKGELRWIILFFQKGGKQKPKLLHPELVPLITGLKADGAIQTYERPKNPSGEWYDFLWRCGAKNILPNVCFHSLRVTAASRMARAGISERKAMEYLSHASTTVHSAYVRWQPEDMEECHDGVL